MNEKELQKKIKELENMIAVKDEALKLIREAFLKLNDGCYPLSYPDSAKWKREAMEAVDKALSTTQPPKLKE